MGNNQSSYPKTIKLDDGSILEQLSVVEAYCQLGIYGKEVVIYRLSPTTAKKEATSE